MRRSSVVRLPLPRIDDMVRARPGVIGTGMPFFVPRALDIPCRLVPCPLTGNLHTTRW
jgi:hypothetical protein